MFPVNNYSGPSSRGSGRGHPKRRGRGISRGKFRFPQTVKPENTTPAAEPPADRKEEKREVKEVTRVIPGITLVGCQVQLSVSTRQVGFLIQELFSLLTHNQVDVQCTRYQLYRVVLYAAAIKLIKQGVNGQFRGSIYQNLDRTYSKGFRVRWRRT